MRFLGEQLNRRGFTVYAPRLPGHGATVNELAHTRRTQWVDAVTDAVAELRRRCRRVVLVGQSMGGSIVASFLENSDQAAVVSKVVLDAPMLSLGATVENAASTAMPVTGGAVPPPVIWAAEQLTTVRYGVDWAAVDYLDDTSWVTVPTLVLHGTADPRVPVAVSEELAAAEPDLVRLVTIADALHVEAWNVDPDRWSQEVVEFLS